MLFWVKHVCWYYLEEGNGNGENEKQFICIKILAPTLHMETEVYFTTI